MRDHPTDQSGVMLEGVKKIGPHLVLRLPDAIFEACALRSRPRLVTPISGLMSFLV
jgi:hypothetical protein